MTPEQEKQVFERMAALEFVVSELWHAIGARANVVARESLCYTTQSPLDEILQRVEDELPPSTSLWWSQQYDNR